MGNPIQYCNTDNPSQIQGWVSHNKGGFVKQPLLLWYAPLPGAYPGGGVNENVSPVPIPVPETESVIKPLHWFALYFSVYLSTLSPVATYSNHLYFLWSWYIHKHWSILCRRRVGEQRKLVLERQWHHTSNRFWHHILRCVQSWQRQCIYGSGKY